MRWHALILALGVWALPCRAAPVDAPTGEAEVKAAVVFNLMQFVQWPSGSLVAESRLIFCAAEGGRFAQALVGYDGTRVRDAYFSFRPIHRHMERLAECRAVFVEAGDPYMQLRAAAASRNQPLLVIGEGDNALQQGATIGVALAGGRVVLDIDLATLRAGGFAVSSKLLRLARRVIE